MTVAVRNGCHRCVAMHAARLGADPALTAAVGAGAPLAGARVDRGQAPVPRTASSASRLVKP